MALAYFQDKVCVVTGGASGLGRALCEELARRGAVVVVADLRALEAGQVAAALGGVGQHEALGLDVTDASAVGAALRDVKRRRGRLDVIVNNAGTVVVGEVRDQALADWERVLAVNLHGVVNGVHHAYRIMVDQGFGHIVNVASGAGLGPVGLLAPYVAAKHGVVGLSQSLRMEALDLGVYVTCVCPGFIKTPLLESPGAGVDAQRALASLGVPPMPPSAAARQALDGVARRQGMVVFPAYVRATAWVWRLFPALYSRLMRRFLQRARQGRPVS